MKRISTLFAFIIAVGAAGTSHAQTCAGEVVKFKETFGAGNGRAQLPAGRTNYNYNSSTSLNDGDYTLSKSSQAKPEWHNSPDHTGDVNGRMMVTNASYSPGEFYQDTVTGLSSLSNYKVYLYAMNVNTVGTCSPNPILPRLQLIVDSYNSDGTFTQISSMISNDIPQSASPTWVEISGQIYLPTDVTAVRYRIINNSTGGCGNDVAIDDITFSQCNPQLLPVNGLSLRASALTAAASVTWSTLAESNTARFEVQKSSDNRNWTSFTEVTAAGNSVSAKEYAVRDNSPYAPVCFYRVRAIDKDGKSVFSNSVVLKMPNAVAGIRLIAYPNPFDDHINIETDAAQRKNVILRLFTINGNIVRTIPLIIKAGPGSTTIQGLSTLPQGMYYLDVADMTGLSLYKNKLLKQ